jgi:hypothetical protein
MQPLYYFPDDGPRSKRRSSAHIFHGSSSISLIPQLSDQCMYYSNAGCRVVYVIQERTQKMTHTD